MYARELVLQMKTKLVNCKTVFFISLQGVHWDPNSVEPFKSSVPHIVELYSQYDFYFASNIFPVSIRKVIMHNKMSPNMKIMDEV